MSHHDAHALSRDEVLVGIDRPSAPILKTVSIVLAAIGVIVFIIGLFMQPDRTWQSLLVNWLYFTTISSAGVMFVAVQRITTARWSRSIIRFLEGYVAFLPVAFVLLILIFIGKNHIFPWTHETLHVPEKQIYLNPAFLIPRSLIAFGILMS